MSSVRHYPAPWAELEFENLVITLHSEFIRDLEHPDLVAAQWDEVMSAAADLAAKPFSRKERFVADVQISGGEIPCGKLKMSLHKFSFDKQDRTPSTTATK